jgi:hypothetical protein
MPGEAGYEPVRKRPFPGTSLFPQNSPQMWTDAMKRLVVRDSGCGFPILEK